MRTLKGDGGCRTSTGVSRGPSHAAPPELHPGHPRGESFKPSQPIHPFLPLDLRHCTRNNRARSSDLATWNAVTARLHYLAHSGTRVIQLSITTTTHLSLDLRCTKLGTPQQATHQLSAHGLADGAARDCSSASMGVVLSVARVVVDVIVFWYQVKLSGTPSTDLGFPYIDASLSTSWRTF